jgi:hypothetical protein
MLPGCGPLDRPGTQRTVGTLGDPHAVALCVFDSQRQLPADLATAHLERIFNPDGQGTGIRWWRGDAYIKHKQYRSHRLQDHDRPGADFDLPMIVPPPPEGSAYEVCTRHLRVDQYRIERGIESKPADKPHQFEIGIARIVFTRESEQLIEICPGPSQSWQPPLQNEEVAYRNYLCALIELEGEQVALVAGHKKVR